MIQSKELRIGNLVSILKQPNNIRINFFLPDGVSIDATANKIYDRRGVKLTKNWLSWFNYENWGTYTVNEFESYERYVLHNFIEGTSNHEVHVIKTSYGGSETIEYITSIDQDEKQSNGRMEFVHDLQNAVYKETGKELEIKQNA